MDFVVVARIDGRRVVGLGFVLVKGNAMDGKRMMLRRMVPTHGRNWPVGTQVVLAGRPHKSESDGVERVNLLHPESGVVIISQCPVNALMASGSSGRSNPQKMPNMKKKSADVKNLFRKR